MEQPIIQPIKGKMFRIASEYKVDKYIIPEGFVYDLASVPRLLWGLLPPFGDYLPACTVHDYLYRYHKSNIEECTRKEADRVMLELSLKNNVRKSTAYLMYLAVRMLGRKRWSKKVC